MTMKVITGTQTDFTDRQVITVSFLTFFDGGVSGIATHSFLLPESEQEKTDILKTVDEIFSFADKRDYLAEDAALPLHCPQQDDGKIGASRIERFVDLKENLDAVEGYFDNEGDEMASYSRTKTNHDFDTMGCEITRPQLLDLIDENKVALFELAVTESVIISPAAHLPATLCLDLDS